MVDCVVNGCPHLHSTPAPRYSTTAAKSTVSRQLPAVGTKSDLPNRRVQEQEGRNWATSRGFAFFEASSASGTGVKALFAGLFGRILSTAAFGIPPELASLAMTVS